MRIQFVFLCAFVATIVSATYDFNLYRTLIESTALDKHGRLQICMGECYGERHEKCQIGRNPVDTGTNCSPKTKLIPRYYTKYNQGHTHKCLSNCDKFSGQNKNWCVTESNWYDCIKIVATNATRHIQTHQRHSHCTGPCQNGRCDVYPSSSDNCNPNDLIFVPNFPTEDATRCVTLCGSTSDSVFMCYDEHKKWVKCYPSPDATDPLRIINQISLRLRGYLDDTGHYIRCPILSGSHRQKRAGEDDAVRRLITLFDRTHSVEEIATYLEHLYPTIHLRWFEPNEYPDPSNESLVQYTIHVPSNDFNSPQVLIPMVVRASYTKCTRAYLERGQYNEAAFQALNPRPNDDHGHLVSHHLGGTEDPYNIVPQARPVNRGGHWAGLEKVMRKFFTIVPDGTIDHTVVLHYDFTVSKRPTMFGIRARFYDNNRELVNKDGQRLNNFSDNEYENMFIENEGNPCGNVNAG